MSLVQLNGTQCVLVLQSIYLQKKIVLTSVCNVAADIDDCLRADCKVLFCWVFSFATLHLLYSGYYLRVLKQHFTRFAERKFLRFPRSSVRREQEVRVDRGLEESFLLAPCRRTHALLLIPCRRTRGRRSYLVSGTSFLPEKI
jgi:hypothetical protein